MPGLWRPIVGIDAFDVREYEIDITVSRKHGDTTSNISTSDYANIVPAMVALALRWALAPLFHTIIRTKTGRPW